MLLSFYIYFVAIELYTAWCFLDLDLKKEILSWNIKDHVDILSNTEVNHGLRYDQRDVTICLHHPFGWL